MSVPVLQTKLIVPALPPGTVPRPRLFELLEDGLRRGRALTLVAAPPGYGKTTLIADWLRTTNRTPAWLTLEESDNDSPRFLRCLVASLARALPGFAISSLLPADALTPPQEEIQVTLLLNELLALRAELLLVLDDYHLIRERRIHAALDYLVEHRPANLHLVLISREEPSLNLARWRARGLLSELRAGELRFLADEERELFRRTFKLHLEPAVVEALESVTEGWVAGLQIAGLSLQARGEHGASEFLRSFHGTRREITDYLRTEVLYCQSAEIQEFLTRTSILEKLSAPLCNALLERQDSREVLRRIEQSNLFLSSLDGERQWYRYHPLLRECLESGLPAPAARELHIRAARWLWEDAQPEEAIRHALLAGENTEAARYLRECSDGLLRHGYLASLQHWLQQLPAQVVRADGVLAGLMGWILVLTAGQPEASESYLRCAEEALALHPDPTGQARLAVLRCKLAIARGEAETPAGARRMTRVLKQALESLEAEDGLFRIAALIMLGNARCWSGDIPGSVRTLREALRLGEAAGQPITALAALTDLTVLLNALGRRREALRICRQTISRYSDEAGRPHPAALTALLQQAALELAGNRLEQAQGPLQQALELAQHLGWNTLSAVGLVIQAELFWARGQAEQAEDAVRGALRLAAGMTQELALARLAEAELNLRLGRFAEASEWAAGIDIDYALAHLLDFRYERETLVYARVLLRQGRQDAAREVLEVHARWAEEHHCLGLLVPNHLLLAELWLARGERQQALEHLGRAVELAAPEGYRGPFLDSSLPLAELQPRLAAVPRRFLEALVRELRTRPQRPVARPGGTAPGAPPAEALSPREMEILELIAEGLSNRQIADRCFVSLATVKTHLNNLYAKLGVGSRTQAMARARRLGLI